MLYEMIEEEDSNKYKAYSIFNSNDNGVYMTLTVCADAERGKTVKYDTVDELHQAVGYLQRGMMNLGYRFNHVKLYCESLK